MSIKESNQLREACRAAANESAGEHIQFTAGNFPEWAKGREEELASVFRHYAEIGARETVNYLIRNSKLV